ncbi:DUF4350 domain-containing protein [Nonlabens marinus]|uniref:DUF4350 domain-containing protein n=1 Tax=Nonlabens marinus S1-08 TaxID=1454201 RepID=W8VXF6_9FLAO|nr:DUF4350 domain-containing protein [Nonlabens marinus]BAO55842.1 hypothetical protein NMS_1833 [Nonlabens marinus S1-08]
MDKRSKIILYALGAILVSLFVVESNRPQPINWSPSYTSGDKVPLGAYVLFDNLPELFKESTVSSVNEVPVDFLRAHQKETDASYIFLNDYLVFDQTETDYLMEFVARGNKVFIAVSNAVGPLADTLKLEVSSNSYYAGGSEDTIRTRLVNPSFDDRSYVYHREGTYRYFEAYDTLRTKVLGEVLAFNPDSGYLESLFENEDEQIEEAAEISDDIEDEEDFETIKLRELKTRKTPQVNFVEIKVGDGAFYYNLNPIAYSNYYLLNGKEAFAAESLSYLNSGPVFFDDYGKSGRKVVSSSIRFILSQSSLRWAYYIAIAGVLLYMLFVSKREQRIVPVVNPLENATVEFTRTIGNLYYQSGDFTSIVEKKITFFLERIRSSLYLNTDKLDGIFIKRLSAKSGKSLDQTRDIIEYINTLRAKPLHNEYELKQLNKRIEAFFKEKK